MRRIAFACLLLVAGSAGCSSYDPDELDAGVEFRALAPLAEGLKAHRVMLAPVQIADQRPAQEDGGAWGPMRFDPRRFDAELERALRTVVEASEGGKLQIATGEGSPAGEAWEQSCDLVVVPRIKRWEANFLGTNGWWYPNALLIAWYFWPIGPQWWIADEDYGVHVEVELDVLAASSEQPLPGLLAKPIVIRSADEDEDELTQLQVAPAPSLSLDDLDRGLDFFGTWATGDLDPDQWDQVGDLLEPYARRVTAVRIAAQVADGIRTFDRGSADRQREVLATTHAVVVGIGVYPDGDCVGAAEDAHAFHDLLIQVAGGDGHGEGPWVPEKNITLLLNGNATSDALLAALKRVRERASPYDTVMIYFAGRGQTKAGSEGLGRFALAMQGEEAVGLDAIAEELGPGIKRLLVVLDADFKEGPRGAGAGAAGLTDAVKRGFLSGGRQGAVVLASQLGQRDVVQTYEGKGLLTQYLLRALQGEADEGGDGLTVADLAGYVEEHVVNLSEVALDNPQRPAIVTLTPGALLR